jgi:folate-binding protein YgfZ
MSETAEQVAARRLPLEEAHRRAGAALVERGGWLLPANYGAAGAEYEAVRGGGAGLFDLSARGRVEVSGREAVQFLNGLVTNDVKALAPGAWMLAAFPNPQGRLVAFARVARAGAEEVFTFDTEPETRERVLGSLERFTLAGDFKVRDLSGETSHLSVQGAGARAVVASALGEAAAGIARNGAAVLPWRGEHSITVQRATHTGEDGYDLIAGEGAAHDLWDALTAAGARPAGHDALEVLRVEAGVPRYGADVDETNVVSEAGLGEALSFTKGCYVGQEIIARIHWRGHVAKRLAGLLPEGEGAIEPGTKLRAADGAREAGRVTSVAYSPRLGRQIALGFVKYDFLAAGTEVLLGEGADARRALVTELPFVRGGWHEPQGGEAA